jgi:DNA-binding transcriptional LysR family regulator
MGMELGAIRQFVETIRAGTITAAAERLHLVQSTVSLSIQNLERELGTTLLFRGREGVSLTPDGEIFFQGCLDILEKVNSLERRIKTKIWGPLRIGSLESVAVTKLTPFLVRFKKKFPQITLSLMTMDHAKLVDHLNRRELDFALITSNEPELLCTPLFSEILGIASPKNAPLLSLKDIITEPFLVLPSGCSFRKRLNDILTDRNIKGEMMEMNSVNGILVCVCAGMGYALTTHSYYRAFPSHRNLNFLPLEKEKLQVFLAKRKDSWSDRSFDAFEKESIASLRKDS